MPAENGAAEAAERAGLAFWMARVVSECDRVTLDFAPDAVHDLRVALRRCRSIAEGIRSFDPCRSWRQMRKAGSSLFKSLGGLRDTQVMIDWMNDPGAPQDASSRILLEHLARREGELKEQASQALAGFDRKKWEAWTARLPKRAAHIPVEGAAFRHLALERWHEAHLLHRQALRNRSHVAFHRLRVGLKKFRYTLENFVPSLHEQWASDLRELQDLLGELHDLHVLLQTAVGIGAVQNSESRTRWRSWTEAESSRRLQRYRQKMTGKESLWRVWRAALPQGEALKAAALERLETWASFRDPDQRRSRRVAQLALQLHDALASQDLLGSVSTGRSRAILQLAALLHEVGANDRRKKSHKKSYRLVNELQPPLGWASEDFRLAALVVLYQRGALPVPGLGELQDLAEPEQQLAMILSGILRLAVRFAVSHRKQLPSVEISKSGQTLVIAATDYDEYSPLAQKLARDRHLLEVACHLPVVIRGN